MKPIFVDTFFYLALLSPKDRAHASAAHISLGLKRPLITTEWVLLELGDALTKATSRVQFLGMLDMIRGNPNIKVVPASPEWFEKGLDLYRARPDKDWGLTDCISFAVMRELGLNEALTGDQHFTQAGFDALLA